MVQGEEFTGLVHHHAPSSFLLSFGATHGNNTHPPTDYFDQERASYFVELEEALMHGVDHEARRTHEDKKPYFSSGTKPATLEIFPSLPVKVQHTQSGNNSQSAGSIDSGSLPQRSESSASRKSYSLENSSDQKQQQEMMMMASGAPNIGTPSNNQATTQGKRKLVTNSTAAKDGKLLDAKTLRRLAQNREAARKSRLRKKAYVQQLESSRIKLQQMEQNLQRARSQGLFLGGGVVGAGGATSSGAAMFDMEYSRWLDDESKNMFELRGALQAHLPDAHLDIIVDECMSHYDGLFRMKGIVAKTDVFHIQNGMWITPVERCFLWIGGFRPSELLKILMPQLDPLTEQQLMGICSLQQSCYQAEEALSQGLEQLHEALGKTIASGSLGNGMDFNNYMDHMVALSKLNNLESFLLQADNLRQQTLHQMRRILTIRQAAKCLLAIGEYYTRLRALSSLWASRPRDP